MPNTSADSPAGTSTPKAMDSADASPLAVAVIRLQSVPRFRLMRLVPCSRVTAVSCGDRTYTLKQYTCAAGADNIWEMFCAPAPESVRRHAVVPPAGSVMPPVTVRNGPGVHAGLSRASLQEKRLPVGSRNVKPL